jgi:zinc D-Ala-D-Ala carboxypeptidase
MTARPDDPIALYQERITQTLRELGIPISFATERRQSLQLEGEDLVSIGLDMAGREQRLERRAAAQWEAMKQAALADAVALAVVSAFRSFDYQRQIIAGKLAAGQTLEQILKVSALPGFSEHHSGRAVDIGTRGCPPLTEAFEHTEAFAWLQKRARDFSFTLSYPRGNPHGVVFEPWHWVFGPSF